MKNKVINSNIVVYIAVIIGIVFIFLRTYNFFNEKINRLGCEANITTLRASIERFRSYRHGEIADDEGRIDMSVLIAAKVLPNKVVCPINGDYKTDPRGQIYCTFHGKKAGGK